MLETPHLKNTLSLNLKKLAVAPRIPVLRHSLVVFLFVLVAVAFSWPLALNMTDHTFGTLTYDRDQNLWTLWWTRQALLDLHVTPYFTNFIYYPNGISLFLYPNNLTTAILSLPLQAIFGLVPSFNLLYYVGLVGGAWGIYCLAFYLTGDNIASFTAGLIFVFAPWQHTATELNQLNIVQYQWITFFTYWLVKYLDWLFPERVARRLNLPPGEVLKARRKYQVRYGVLSALFLVLIAFTDQYHLLYAVCLLVWLSAVPLFKQLLQKDWRGFVLKLLKLALLAVPVGIAFFRVMVGFVKDVRSGIFLETENSMLNGLDLVSLISPWGFEKNIFGKVLQLRRERYLDPGLYYSVGWWVVLVLAVYAVWKIRSSRSWGLLALVASFLALGETLYINGVDTGFPLFGKIISQTPVLQVMHYARRWTLPGSLGLAICAGYGLAYLREKLNRSSQRNEGVKKPFNLNTRLFQLRIAVVPLVIVIVLSSLQPYPIAWDNWAIPPTPPVFTKNVLTNPGALLDLPFDESNVDKADNMRYQTLSGRPMVEGYLARKALVNYDETPFAFFFEDYPIAAKDIVQVTPEAVQSMLSYYRFAYFLLDKSQLSGQRIEYFRQLIGQSTGAGKNGCVYEDDLDLACPITAPQTPVPFMALSRGWYAAEAENGGQRWLRGQEAFVGLFVPAEGTYKLNFEGAAYLKERHLTIEIDGQQQAQATIAPGRQNYSLELKLSGGNHIMRLYSPEQPDRPSNNGTPADTRTLTLLFSKLQVTGSK